MEEPKLYVVVDSGLNKSYQGVQGAHAVAEWIIQKGLDNGWRNGILVFVKGNVDDFLEVADVVWREPDLGDKATAVATLGTGGKHRLFKELPLM